MIAIINITLTADDKPCVEIFKERKKPGNYGSK